MKHELTAVEHGGRVHRCSCSWQGVPVRRGRLRCPLTVIPETEAVAREEGLILQRVNPQRVDGARVGRNEPCPCGSGAKYKRCCGA